MVPEYTLDNIKLLAPQQLIELIWELMQYFIRNVAWIESRRRSTFLL